MAPALVRRLRLKRYDILSGSLFHCTYFRKRKFHPPVACPRVNLAALSLAKKSPSSLRRVVRRDLGGRRSLHYNHVTTLQLDSPRYLTGTSSKQPVKGAQSRKVHSWVAGGQSRTSSRQWQLHVDSLLLSETIGTKWAEGFGGPGRDRTDDLFHAMEARSQLRHRPTLR